MYVNAHAQTRIRDRIGTRAAAPIIDRLERTAGAPGRVAIALARVDNGDTLVAIVKAGEVCTIMLRRAYQPFTPSALGVDSVTSLLTDVV